VYLVTGGAGFIGSHTVEELVRSGESVRVLDDLSTGKKSNLSAVLDQIDLREGDIRDLEAIRSLFEGADYVIHFAAASSVLRSIQEPVATTQVNLMGTLQVLVAARDAHVKRVIMAATGAIYGDNPVLPRVETQTPDPLSPYAIVKLAGEYFGQVFYRLFGLEFVALRYFNIFGPRQNPLSPYSGVLSKFVRAYLTGTTPTIHGTGEQSRDFTYVANVVDATMRACHAREAPGKIINIGTGRGTSLNDAIRMLNQILGAQVTPNHDPPRVGDFMHSTADITRARTVLGYEPIVSFEEGLRRTVDWMRTTLV
jgi:nucleoside-diphosphate-sugar epimerase